MKSQILNIQSNQIEKQATLRKLPTFKSKIAVSLSTGIVIIPVAEILYCQAQSSYSKIVLKSGKQYLISKTMKKVEATLDPIQFIKVHQSFIVSIDSICMLDEGLTLQDETKIPVSRAKRKELLQQLGKRYQMV